MFWVIAILKRRGVLLGKVSPNITYEQNVEIGTLLSFVTLHYSPWMPSFEMWRSPAMSSELKPSRER